MTSTTEPTTDCGNLEIIAVTGNWFKIWHIGIPEENPGILGSLKKNLAYWDP
jgi:hypothetical protein